MKKLTAAAALFLSASAFAGIPAGYSLDQNNSSENQMTFVNVDKEAMITMVKITNSAKTPAELSQALVAEYGCPDTTVLQNVNDNVSGFEKCTLSDDELQGLVMIDGQDTIMIVGNKNVSDADLQTFLAN